MAASYNIIDDFANILVGSVIEIGTDRGEGSTDYIAQVSKASKCKFYTVDFDLDLPERSNAIQFRITGEEFFAKHFPEDEKVCFAYLDGFDWIYDDPDGWIPDWIPAQIDRYEHYGIKMNNTNSQLSHLNLTKAVASSAADKCVILYDDTFHTGEYYDGKGGSAIDWLIEQGWYEINTNEYNAKAFRNWL